MAAYGLAVVVGTYGFLVLALLAWRSRIGDLLEGWLSPAWTSIVEVVVVAMVAFPVWSAPVRWLARRVRRRRDARGTAPAPAMSVTVEGTA